MIRHDSPRASPLLRRARARRARLNEWRMSRQQVTSPSTQPREAPRWHALIDWLALLMLLAAGVVWPP
jgi:hypothetical protein